MQTYLAPYVHFPTNCAAEAFAAYGKVFGVEPVILRTKDMPGDDNAEGMPEDMVMHAQLKTDHFTIYGSDDCMNTRTPIQGFELCIFADDSEQVRDWFDQLSAEGATVHVPLDKQPWGDTYGQFTDRFGLTWAFNLS
ncbi:VOC family protein [Naumannella sp. ID2617S]|nr:VOC family protein [Enemella dayhoffiae]NNG19349.1 VOC family protein [Naumannella sp. ID2617S]